MTDGVKGYLSSSERSVGINQTKTQLRKKVSNKCSQDAQSGKVVGFMGGGLRDRLPYA